MSKKPWLLPLVAMAIPQLFAVGAVYGMITSQVGAITMAITEIAKDVKENGKIMQTTQLVITTHSSELRHHAQRIRDLERK